MTDEEIDAAIAEARGFVLRLKHELANGEELLFWDYPESWMGPDLRPWAPKFCSDLNAMHEVEKMLKGYEQIHTYVWHLNNRNNWETDFKLMEVHISARERAEAFLKTIGKWKEVQS